MVEPHAAAASRYGMIRAGRDPVCAMLHRRGDFESLEASKRPLEALYRFAYVVPDRRGTNRGRSDRRRLRPGLQHVPRQRRLGQRRNDRREVVADPRAGYYGMEVDTRSLVPGDDARLGEIRFEDWLGQPALAK